MYKVFLVDDNVPMLKYLSKAIPWEALGLQLCGVHYSSAKAFQAFQVHLPDLVITDIGLPQTDGLELAEQCRKLKPDTRIIFITCHEDFDYAKRAIALHAVDYLLKDHLQDEQLIETIKKAVTEIKRHNESSASLSYRETFAKHREVLKQTFLEQLVRGGIHYNVIEDAERIGITWGEPDFLIAEADMDYSTFNIAYRFKDIDLIQYGMYNIALDLVNKYPNITPFMDKQARLFFVMNFRFNLSNRYTETFVEYMEMLREHILDFLKIETTYVYSRHIVDLHNLQTELRRLSRIASGCYYSYYPISEASGQSEDKWDLLGSRRLHPLKQQWLQAYRERNAEQLIQIVEELVQLSRLHNIHPHDAIQVSSQWMRAIEVECIEESGHTEAAFYYYLTQTCRIEQLQSLLVRRATQLIKHLAKKPNDKSDKEDLLHLVDQYMIKHLHEHTKTTDIAAELYLNPSYFSRTFKRLTGENFTDYMHRFKVDIASKMLRDKNWSVEDISKRLGYYDRAYFSKVFKRYQGISPGEYKQRQHYYN